MLSWKDVLPTVGSALGNEAGDCVLEFLKILPEEVTEGRKINLSVCSAESPSMPIHLSHLRSPNFSSGPVFRPVTRI